MSILVEVLATCHICCVAWALQISAFWFVIEVVKNFLSRQGISSCGSESNEAMASSALEISVVAQPKLALWTSSWR